MVDTGDLPPIVDPRYPGSPAYGPRDITTAFASDLDPNATTASLIFALGGSPSGQPPIPPIPEPGTISLLGVGLLAPLLSLRKRTG
ncbi:MAG: PEP-CTERM sorting domain-containing protein [Armatimonadota bacterium]